MTVRPAWTPYAAALVSVGLASSAQLLLKAGLGPAAGGLPDVLAAAVRSPLVLLGVTAFAASSAMWLVVLSHLRLSVAYPIGALSYVVVVGTSALLGERVSAVRWAGVLLVALGVALVGGADAVGAGGVGDEDGRSADGR